ncbi:MAG TPA: hypothetical protein VD978_16760 [Azospirillum sp.]|nr:hypothetical protein [Azospirillum sp.]
MNAVIGATVRDLSEGECAVLMAVRLWFRGGTLRSMAAIRAAFRSAGIPADALLPLFAMLGVFATDQARPLTVLSPAALDVGADEAALLEALGALQHGNDDAGLNVLDRWLPLVALCVAATSARELGRLLAGAGVFLPYGRAAAASLPLAAE